MCLESPAWTPVNHILCDGVVALRHPLRCSGGPGVGTPLCSDPVTVTGLVLISGWYKGSCSDHPEEERRGPAEGSCL